MDINQDKIDRFVEAVLKLDEGDLIDAFREVCMASPEHLAVIKVAAQDVLESWKDIQAELVYCPMCEMKHENNTLCQRPAQEENNGNNL